MKLSTAFAGWVRAMNQLRNCTQADRAKIDAEIAQRHNDMIAATLDEASWDAADRLAWSILQAFDVAHHGS